MNPKAAGYLSLARRGRMLEIGEEPVGALCRARKARLVIVASDASDHTFRRVKSFVAGSKQIWMKVDVTKDELGDLIGYSSVAMAAFVDVRMALAFVQALGEPEKHAELLAALEEKSIRAEQRQKEEKAHQKNLRRGGKKK